ncbi:CCC motif membrane protein [Flavobacterium sp.]|uniref:CCC motif membrane protein n=1 Tax=Flavobacterium sp. TaxID=239 RepID=UPI00286E3FE0|nr:CCC motif membrane protein [Flavobacterium sp.]
MQKQKLPNATAVLILGIFSILTCCCYGVLGLILGIVALVLAKKDLALYAQNPELYSDYSNLNTGKILAIIGIVLSAIYLVWNIYLFSSVGAEGLEEMQREMLDKLQNR